MSGATDPVLAAITALAERFDRLERETSGLREDTTQLREESSRLREDTTRLRVDLMARLDRQQDMLTSIRNDIGVNMATADRVREANKATRDDVAQLASQVSVIHRRLIQLEERFDRQAGT